MSIKEPAPLVVLGWAGGNAANLAILAGYGGGAQVLGLYAGACTILGFFALAVFLSWMHHPQPTQRYRVSSRGGASLAGAIGCAFGGLCFVFGYWFLLISLPAVAYAVAVLPRGRNRLPSSS